MYSGNQDKANNAQGIVCTAQIYDEYGNQVDLGSTSTKPDLNKNMSAAGYRAATTAVTNTNGGILQITKGTYSMNSGTISGVSAVNGGAIYVGDGATFILNGGTIENCSAQNGGAIYVDVGGRLIVNGGQIINCKATATNGRGGAIYLKTEQDVYINGLTITSCSAEQYGGAIYNLTNNVMLLGKNLSITDCQAEKGCAVYINRGDVTFYGSVFNCSVPNPSMGDSNGTIYVGNDSTLTLARFSSIEECSAYKGGAVYATDTAIINMQSNVLIEDCQAIGGGGAFALNMSAILNINGGIIRLCGGPGQGGAIYAAGSCKITMSNGTIDDCDATHQGGGVCLIGNSQFDMQGGEITNCQTQAVDGKGAAIYAGGEGSCSVSGGSINYCRSYKGGGIYVNTAKFVMSGGSIEHCDADMGGAIYGSIDVNIIGGTIYDCTSVSYGGAISCVYLLDIKDCTIDSCTSYKGGAIHTSYLTCSNIQITNCKAAYGGGIMVDNSKSIIIQNSRITACSATYSGGALYVSSATSVSLYNNQFTNCTAENGGGIHLSSGSVANLYNGSISNCTANYKGGGIYSYHATIYYYDMSISNCKAVQGGAIKVGESSKLIMESGTIGDSRYANANSYATSSSHSNTADDGAGLFVAEYSTVTINGGNILYNYANDNGGGIYVQYLSKIIINNCNIRCNAAASTGGGIFANDVVVMYSGTLCYNYSYNTNRRGYDAYINNPGRYIYLDYSHIITAGRPANGEAYWPYFGGESDYFDISSYDPQSIANVSSISVAQNNTNTVIDIQSQTQPKPSTHNNSNTPVVVQPTTSTVAYQTKNVKKTSSSATLVFDLPKFNKDEDCLPQDTCDAKNKQ